MPPKGSKKATATAAEIQSSDGAKGTWAAAKVDSGFFYKIGLRSALGPLLLMSVTPIIPTAFLITCNSFDGDFIKFLFACYNDIESVKAVFPWPTVKAAQILATYFVWQWCFLMFLPGKYYTGPATETNQRPVYKENAVLAFITTHIILGAGLHFGYIDAAEIFKQFPAMVSIMTPSAFLFCALLYIKGRWLSNDPDKRITESFIWDFYWGVEIHPRLLGVNVKQWMNCRVAMMGWASLLVIYCYAQLAELGRVNNSLLVSVFLQLVYIYKFFVWEAGYMHSIDIILDRAGYYIIWGVLAWLPTIYTVHSYYMVKVQHQLDAYTALAILLFGLASIAINYQADWQRQITRSTNGKCNVWPGVPATFMPAKFKTKDGTEHNTILLTNGWWGVARHFNYIPELCLALSWCLPAAKVDIIPYFYFVYLCILLTDRAVRDDKRCGEKYGQYWEQYKAIVPYSLIPGII